MLCWVWMVDSLIPICYARYIEALYMYLKLFIMYISRASQSRSICMRGYTIISIHYLWFLHYWVMFVTLLCHVFYFVVSCLLLCWVMFVTFLGHVSDFIIDFEARDIWTRCSTYVISQLYIGATHGQPRISTGAGYLSKQNTRFVSRWWLYTIVLILFYVSNKDLIYCI